MPQRVRDTSKAGAVEFEDQRFEVALEDLGRLIGHSLAAPVLLLDPHLLKPTGSLGVRPVARGIEAERDTWRHVFGDALRIELVEAPDRSFIGVRGAALAVHRARTHRRLGNLVRQPDLLDAHTISLGSLAAVQT